jgi:CBS domain-containing protein
MSTVKQLLDQKGHDVETIHPDDTVYNAIKRMAELNIGSLMVVEDGKPVGIISERHYARNVYLKGKASPETHVRDIMEADFAYVRPNQTNQECMAIMTAKRTRHLPVLQDKDLIGMVSIGDLVKSIIAEQELTIVQLQEYIHRG